MIYRSSAILAILVLGLGATAVVADDEPGDPLGEVRVTIDNAPITVNEGENITLTYTRIGTARGNVFSQWWGLYGTNTPTGYNPHTYFDNWQAAAPIAREMNARYSQYTLNLQVDFSTPGGPIFDSTTLTVLNMPPVAGPGGPYLESDWAGGVLRLNGWFSQDAPANSWHQISLYEWDLNNDAIYEIQTIEGYYDLTLSELRNAFTPDAWAAIAPGTSLTLGLRVTDDDGAANSTATGGTTFFTPEPATLSLLALGGLAALVRRRRRK